MEVKKKLKMPSGNIHDIRYLYSVLAGLKRKGGRVPTDAGTLEYFKKMINEYNESRASKYGLSFAPREVNIKVVRHATLELRHLNLVYTENREWALTNQGEAVATLIERKDAGELRRIFIELMLDRYQIFEVFLRRVKEVSGGSGVPIPFLTAELLDRCGGESKQVVEGYVNIVTRGCPSLMIQAERLYELLESAGVDAIERRTEKINRLQASIEKFVVSSAFAPGIQSRRAYDLARSRMTFLGLTNFAVFNYEGFPAETAYLISDFEPTLPYARKGAEYSKGIIYLNCPTYEDIRERLKDSLARVYMALRDEFGYVKIADARDLVCRELRISDALFDEDLKRMYEEEPHWLSFTYSGAGDRVTEKRLPIIFEKPMREFFTLLKMNLRR